MEIYVENPGRRSAVGPLEEADGGTTMAGQEIQSC